MTRLIGIFLLALASVYPVYAQQETPNYRIANAVSTISSNQTEVIITFAVYNSGGPANRTANVEVINLRNGETIVTGSIPPLGRGENTGEVEIRFPVTQFPPGSDQFLQIAVGVGDIEAEDAPTIGDNRYGVRVIIPEYTSGPTQTQPPDPVQIQPNTPDPDAASGTSRVLKVPGLNLEIDLSSPAQVAILGGITVSALVIILIMMMILRLLFRREPPFGNWQPPYATVPPMDPNSTYGRRQLWQQHAQNNALPRPCTEGSIHARKVLLGMDGYYLSGWKITAMRVIQYDMYGRVSRSQVMASSGQIKRLNRAARKSTTLDVDRLGKRMRPVAKGLANRLKKKINRRSAMLPIALDVRLQGTHGEVRIVFELYQCRGGQPQQVDYWEPEMTVLGKMIQESYTFTVYGQSAGETFSEYRRRLPEDIKHVLVDMLSSLAAGSTSASKTGPATPVDGKARTEPNMPAVNINREI